jgi:hypothetical protein
MGPPFLFWILQLSSEFNRLMGPPFLFWILQLSSGSNRLMGPPFLFWKPEVLAIGFSFFSDSFIFCSFFTWVVFTFVDLIFTVLSSTLSTLLSLAQLHKPHYHGVTLAYISADCLYWFYNNILMPTVRNDKFYIYCNVNKFCNIYNYLLTLALYRLMSPRGNGVCVTQSLVICVVLFTPW